MHQQKLLKKKKHNSYSSIIRKKTPAKMTKGMNTHFTIEDSGMANKLMKRHSISFVIKRVQMKTTMT